MTTLLPSGFIETLTHARTMRRQLRALYSNQSIIEFLPDESILTANSNFLGTMGYTLEQIQGQHHRLFVHPEEVNAPAYALFWKRLNEGEAFIGRCRRIRGDGSDVWLQANYSPVLREDGSLLKVVKYAMDITPQVLSDAEAQGQLVAINRAQAVIEFALDGTILRANRNFLDTLGYRDEREIVGKHHGIFMFPEDSQSLSYTHFWEHLGSGQFHAGQFRRMSRQGKPVWIEASYNPIFDDAGRPFKVVKYATDITERFEATQTLQGAFEQLNGLVTESAARADEAFQQTQQVLDVAREGAQTTAKAVETMAEIRVDSQRIADIVGLIDGIAFQTNLLALNAAVEAAHAGEQGRGFAVVAAEVRTLAQRAASAAQEVKSLIATSTQRVQSGDAHVQAAGAVMEDITSSAGHAAGIMGSIVDATKAQHQRMGSVHAAMSLLEAAVTKR